MSENLLLTYCNYHPGFMEELESFSEKKAIYNKLNVEKSEIQFLSTVSEFYFGKFFQNLGLSIVYEKKYLGKTPDWTLKIGNDIAIVDVYRLNSTQRSKEINFFQGKLFEEIQSLNYNIGLKISFNENLNNLKKNNISDIVKRLNKWLLEKKVYEVGNKVVILEFFTFEIIKINTQFKYVSCIGNLSSLDYKLHKLNQYKWLDNKNEITKKLSKYNDVITENNLPYFIAIDVEFLSGFEYYEFKEYFRGKEVFFIDYGIDLGDAQGLDDIKYLGQEWTELGLFYENINLSGLFIRHNKEIKLLLNPLKKQIIYDNKCLLETFINVEKL